jgi:dinuclear metal center YbgI/SA1388 family protein
VITVADLCAHLDSEISFSWAEPWDQVGLTVGDPRAAVDRVLVTLDPTPSALGRAVQAGANVLVTHHPAFIEPLERVVAAPGSAGVAFEAARLRIALVSCHTNLDRAPLGAGALPASLGLTVRGPLERRDPDLPCAVPNDTPLAGRLCDPGDARTLGALAALVAERLGVGVRMWGDSEAPVTLVALAPGSGRSLVEDAMAGGADSLVTGELRYHVAHDALMRGLSVIEAGHDATEWPLTEALARIVGRTPGLESEDVISDVVGHPWRTIAKGIECM